MTATHELLYVTPPPRPELAVGQRTPGSRSYASRARAHGPTPGSPQGKLPQRAVEALMVMLLGLAMFPISGCGAAALSHRRQHVSGVVAAGRATYAPGPEVCGEENREDLCGNAVSFRWGYGVSYELVIWETRARNIAIAAEVPLTALHGTRRFESSPDVPGYSGLWVTPAPKLVLGRSKRGQFGVSAGPGWVRFSEDSGKGASRRSVDGTVWQFGMTGDWQLRPAVAVRAVLRVFDGQAPPEWATVAQPVEHSLMGAGLVLSF